MSIWGDLAVSPDGVMEWVVIVEKAAHHQAYCTFCWCICEEPAFAIHESVLEVFVMLAKITIGVGAQDLSAHLTAGKHEWALNSGNGLGAEAGKGVVDGVCGSLVVAVFAHVVGAKEARAVHAKVEGNDCRVIPGLGASGCSFAFGSVFA